MGFEAGPGGRARPHVSSDVVTAPPVQFRKAALVGVAAGLLGGLFGVGGGLIMVPGLIGVAKMERRRAHGTSLAATLPISLASLATYLAHGNVDWAVALFITIGALAGAIVGTHLLHVIPKNVLVLIFVATILATATRLLFDSARFTRASTSRSASRSCSLSWGSCRGRWPGCSASVAA